MGAVSLALMISLARVGATADVKEYEIKAAFIYNFAKFVEWPEDAFGRADAPIVIGIVGKDPFGKMIDQAVEGRRANGRPVEIKRVNWGAEVKTCHILFVSSSESGKMGQLSELIKNAPVLTIGETAGFASRGGIVNFTEEGGKVRFEINVDAAKRARLTISSKLLSLAKVVKDAPSKS
jgi:hypothetical protein